MNATANQRLDATLIAMERAALDRWSKGDTFGFLEISAPDVLYFDPYLDRRIDRGKPNCHTGMNVTEVFRKDDDRWQIIHTHLAFTKTAKS